MDEKFIRIRINEEEKAIWRVSEEQFEVINALDNLGVFRNDAVITELFITLMN